MLVLTAVWVIAVIFSIRRDWLFAEALGKYGFATVVILWIVYLSALAGVQKEEQDLTEKCLIALERAQKAEAGPNGYWADQLRDSTAEDAKPCVDWFAKKKAEGHKDQKALAPVDGVDAKSKRNYPR